LDEILAAGISGVMNYLGSADANKELATENRTPPPESAASVNRRPIRKALSITIQAVFCVLVLFLVAGQLVDHWESVRKLRPPSLHWFMLGSALATIGLLSSAWICQNLLASLSVSVSFVQSIGLVYVPMLGKYLPGRGWSLPASFWLYGRLGIPASTSAPCISWSLLLSLTSSVMISAGLGIDPGAWALWPVVVTVVVLCFCPSIFQKTADLFFRLLRRERMLSTSFSRTRCASLFAVNCTAWLIYGLGFVCLVSSMVPVPLVAVPKLVGLFAFAQVAGFVAFFAPAGVGVREGVFLVGLSPLVGESEALAIAVLCRVWQTALELLMAILGWLALNDGWRINAGQNPRCEPQPENIESVP
jgi:glycosyltransferase 2 family protein